MKAQRSFSKTIILPDNCLIAGLKARPEHILDPPRSLNKSGVNVSSRNCFFSEIFLASVSFSSTCRLILRNYDPVNLSVILVTKADEMQVSEEWICKVTIHT